MKKEPRIHTLLKRFDVDLDELGEFTVHILTNTKGLPRYLAVR